MFRLATKRLYHKRIANSKSLQELRLARLAWNRTYSPGLLTESEFNHYQTKGFVLKHDVFKPAELDYVKDSVSELVDQLANRLYAAGKIKDLAKQEGFYTRLTKIEEQFPNASVLLHKNGVLPKAVQKLWSDERLLSAAAQVLGNDLAGHPVWNLRTKTPQQSQATVPLHQDSSYLSEECWSVHQLTAWIPLLDTNYQNGCMQVISGGDHLGATAPHSCCLGDTWYNELSEQDCELVLDAPISNTVTCEVPLGSVLFLNNLIPHRSLNNNSNQIRWSFDLRWQRPNEPNGFEGIKDCILMRDSKNPLHRIDWDEWSRKDRTELQRKATHPAVLSQAHVIQSQKGETWENTDFDTTISGPWMNRWPLVNHNRHTESHLKAKNAGQVSYDKA